jgi:2-hydroxychromene-2-carboxylate isomerase
MDIDMRRYADRFGIEFHQNPFFPINAMVLMRAALVSMESDCFDLYMETVFNAMWREPKNLADLDVLTEVLVAAGLDAKQLPEGTQQSHTRKI